MSMREFYYRWEFDLESTPDQLWPLVADTNRFNRDTGVPSVKAVTGADGDLKNARRRLRLSAFGIPVEWEEQPFEWVRPNRFGVVRRYTKGPVAELRVRVELQPRSADSDSVGTKLIYEVWAKPRNVIGLAAIPIQIGVVSRRNFATTIYEYDRLARHERRSLPQAKNVEFAAGGRQRLLTLSDKLLAQGSDAVIISLLVDHVENADEFSLARIRPYELARQWDHPRRAVLQTFLCATRVGILDLQWNLICPMCRGGEAK